MKNIFKKINIYIYKKKLEKVIENPKISNITKMVKKYKNLPKITIFKKSQIFDKYFFVAKKKCPFRFSILGLCNSTKALQSSPLLRKQFGKISKDLKKSLLFKKKI